MYSSPVRHSPPSEHAPAVLPFDLHVLGLPPAFTLSQDQTLHLKTHSPKTKNLKLQMLDRWQRFACFKTIDMLLDQTSARWTYILPAGALTSYLRTLSKIFGSRPQRLPPFAPTFPSLRAAHCRPAYLLRQHLFSRPFHRSEPLLPMPLRRLPQRLSSLRAAYYVRLFVSVNTL